MIPLIQLVLMNQFEPFRSIDSDQVSSFDSRMMYSNKIHQQLLGWISRQVIIRINDQAVKLAIWDTAGSERFRTLTPNFYRGAHGAILVYDVTRRETFNRLDSWMKEVDIYSTRNEMVKMVIGNKIDKCEEGEDGIPKMASQVPREEAVRWARKNSTLFIEASARTSEGVRTAFEELVQKILETPGLWEATSRRTNIRLDQANGSQGQNWCQGWCV